MPMRIGSVSYLNAMPLVHGLASDPEVTLLTDSPAGIAGRLESGELDAGLVPVAEAARQRLWAMPGPAVAARGPVRSVFLISREEPARIRTLALDPASRSSVILARLLLARVHGLSPTLVAAEPEGDPMPSGADAVVVIGDRALKHACAGLRVIDLAQWWVEWSSRPFVFALWAARDPRKLQMLAPRLVQARAAGLESLPEIARREGPLLGIAWDEAFAYLSDAIHYDAGPGELAGLALFLSLARESHLLPADADLRFIA